MIEGGTFGKDLGRKVDYTLPEHLRIVKRPNDRVLAYADYGKLDGNVVLLIPGTHGSRIGPLIVLPHVLYQQNMRLISLDPPGNGYSTRYKGRKVADMAEEVEAILDDLQVEKAFLVGRSAGGADALACAALIPSRVRKVATLCSLSPKGIEDRENPQAGKGWYMGMTEENVRILGNPWDEEILEQRREVIRRTQQNPRYYIDEYLWNFLTPFDRAVLMDRGIYYQQVRAYAEAVRQGPEAWFDQTIALHNDWGFDLSDIMVPTLIWHGAEDVLTPKQHAECLKEMIPHAELIIQPQKAHFNSFEAFPDIILPWFNEK